MIGRRLSDQILKSLKAKKSVLLLGPRQTGKSTLIQSLRLDVEFNLARQQTFLEFARDPGFLESRLKALLPKGGLVFIDEVQRVPSILNTIQYLIDQKNGFQFVLTGSSARKLRRGHANLLPGRLHVYQLGPIVASELEYLADTNKLMQYGSLPAVITETDIKNTKKLLKDYSLTYLNEEVRAEALTKNIEGFTRFLFALSADSSKFLDLSKISSTAAVPRQTTQRFFEVLEDTLIVRRLNAFAKSEKRRLIQHPKFFIFDTGVLNALLGNFNVSVDRKGTLFENLIFNQLATSLSYSDCDYRLSSYRTDAGAEVDIILELDGRTCAIEIKSGHFSKSDLGGLKSFEQFYGKKTEKFVLTDEQPHRVVDDIECLPWQEFFKKIKI